MLFGTSSNSAFFLKTGETSPHALSPPVSSSLSVVMAYLMQHVQDRGKGYRAVHNALLAFCCSSFDVSETQRTPCSPHLNHFRFGQTVV